MKKITILGSTGSIGTSTLEVVRQHPDRFQVVGLTAGSNSDLLREQITEFKPAIAAMQDTKAAETLSDLQGTEIRSGQDGIIDVATMDDTCTVVSAIVGSAGLVPTMRAIEAGKHIALANKEPLVMAGEIIMGAVKSHQVSLIPVDSEHSAIFQSLASGRSSEVSRIFLTASGGPFHTSKTEELKNVTVSQALKHPTWSMGQKITIDSATLMNKALEIIEAHWLFDVSYDQIDVIVHPQSIIHSMVEFMDGAVVAQIGIPSMKLPIQYALTWPERLESDVPPPNFKDIQSLTFSQPNPILEKALKFAYRVGKEGGTAPTVMNAANEAAVALFLNEQCRFLDIYDIIEKALDQHQTIQNPTLEQIIEADAWTREKIITNYE